MYRKLTLVENGIEVAAWYNEHNDHNGSGLSEDMEQFITKIENKKQELIIIPQARKLGEITGQKLRKTLYPENPSPAYNRGAKVAAKITGAEA